MTAPLGICRGCNGRTPLRRISGKVRIHDLLLPGGVQRCPGSGELPKDGTSK